MSKEGENASLTVHGSFGRRTLRATTAPSANIHDGEMSLYNVAYPGNPSHVANQQYVDDKFDAIGFQKFLKLT